MTRAPFLVLGLGNTLLGDEGLGVAAAERLAGWEIDGVDVVDGGTLGLGLVPELEDREGVVVLDAVLDDTCAPGALLELGEEELPAVERRFASAHDVGLTHALAVAQLAGRAPRRVAVLGLVPASLDGGVALSAIVQDRLDDLIVAAVRTLRQWLGEEVAGDAEAARHA